MKFFLGILIVFYLTSFGMAQTGQLAEAETRLETLLSDLRSAQNNADKKQKNQLFKDELVKVLESPESMTYPFSKLTTLGVIDSPDKQLRIVNWNVEKDDLSQEYHCFVMHVDKRRKTHHVTELKDISFGMPTQPTEIISADEWYGALYYKIIPVKKGSRTIYTVLGWDYYSSMSQMKLVDAIYVSGTSIKLGSPIFKMGKETKKRVYFEHSKKTSMSLKYEPTRSRIIFDHLSPESPSMKNFRSFYVPDLSYDAFVLEGNKWVLVEDVIGTNSEGNEKKQVVYVKNERTGKVEAKEIKTKWINPEDPDAPAGGSEHVAVTPETEVKSKDASSETDTPKIDKRDKRDPSNISFYKELEKGKKKKRKQRR